MILWKLKNNALPYCVMRYLYNIYIAVAQYSPKALALRRATQLPGAAPVMPITRLELYKLEDTHPRFNGIYMSSSLLEDSTHD